MTCAASCSCSTACLTRCACWAAGQWPAASPRTGWDLPGPRCPPCTGQPPPPPPHPCLHLLNQSLLQKVCFQSMCVCNMAYVLHLACPASSNAILKWDSQIYHYCGKGLMWQSHLFCNLGLHASHAQQCQGHPSSCRLVNRSGLRLSYWTDDVGEDGEVGCAYTLNAWEESPLLVDPVERTVIIPDTQQQASCHHPG